MGRIKTTLVKRVTHELMKLHSNEFTANFKENQQIANKFVITASKGLRNKIAGYVTKLVKRSRKSEE